MRNQEGEDIEREVQVVNKVEEFSWNEIENILESMERRNSSGPNQVTVVWM